MRVRLLNRQSEIPVRVRPLLRQLKSSLSLLPGPLPAHLSDIEVILIDRATMAQVHGDFLGDPTETDVITFPYGEILVCPAVASEQATSHGLKLEQEVLLYALHGILHLVGYDDTTPAKERKMAEVQMQLLKRVLES